MRMLVYYSVLLHNNKNRYPQPLQKDQILPMPILFLVDPPAVNDPRPNTPMCLVCVSPWTLQPNTPNNLLLLLFINKKNINLPVK